ncbi:MAG TPA: hypothetical protein VNT79_05105 [Phycisphaerae bacterium]|nr:hypothetical protein [Phycisphaerae bacterium]
MQPTSIYAAAGLPGYWNAMTAANGTTTFNLKNLAGVSTPVRLYQYGGTQLMHINDPLTSGDDQTLMDHFLVTYTPSLETCLFFNDLQNGVYEVLTYGWMPRNPGIMAYTSSDEEPGYPHEIVGGAWPGGHQELVTYSRHYCIVGPPVNGRLRVHSGIVPGAPAANGAAMNGVQIRKLPAAAPADMNCDGAQDAEDVGIFIQALVDRESYYADHPTCRILNGDLNGDWDIDTDDVAPFVTALLN